MRNPDSLTIGRWEPKQQRRKPSAEERAKIARFYGSVDGKHEFPPTPKGAKVTRIPPFEAPPETVDPLRSGFINELLARKKRDSLEPTAGPVA